MKIARVLKVMLIFISFILITGCDSGGGNDSGPWTIVYPADGATNIPCNITYELKYSGNLDTTVDTEQILLTPGTGAITHTYNSSSSIISITGDTVTINMNDGQSLASDQTYISITISGFKDAEGNDIGSFTTSGYQFTTEPK